MFKIEKIQLDLETGLLSFVISEESNVKDAMSLYFMLLTHRRYQTIEKKLVLRCSSNLKVEINNLIRKHCDKENTISISSIYSCQMKHANYKIRLLKSYKNYYYQFVGKKKINKPTKIETEQWERVKNNLLTEFTTTIVYLNVFTLIPDAKKMEDILTSLTIN